MAPGRVSRRYPVAAARPRSDTKTDIRHPGTIRTRSKGVDATSTLFQRLGWDIHAFIRKRGAGGGAALWCPWCHRASSTLPWLLVPGRRAVHTAWMPRSCRSSSMVASAMLSGSGAGRTATGRGAARDRSRGPLRPQPFAVTEYCAPDNTIRADDACAIFSCHAHLDGVPKVSRMFR